MCHGVGAVVANVPSYGENSVAEHAFALLFAVARRLCQANQRTKALDFSLEGLEGFDLKGKTLGVVGAGRIGQQAIRIGRGLGMAVLAFDVRPDTALAERERFRYVALADLLSASDVLTLHANLTPQTHHLIDRDALESTKRAAILINTARGGLVDSDALCEALCTGHLAGAGLDVFEGEELIREEAVLLRSCPTPTVEQLHHLASCHALIRRNDVVMTPHVAFFTKEGVGRLIATSLSNIMDFRSGAPQNLVE